MFYTVVQLERHFSRVLSACFVRARVRLYLCYKLYYNFFVVAFYEAPGLNFVLKSKIMGTELQINLKNSAPEDKFNGVKAFKNPTRVK
jgi:hypothetical protein